ncbi:MAG: GNAT family N-acetyltransferase [Acidimicrobiales bacterium]
MELQVRTIDASEIGDWVACMGVGFLRPRAEGFAEYFLGEIDLDRTWGAFDSGRVVGTLRSFATRLTVPGPAEQDASAITNVTVVPTHRRQGLMRDMVIADLDSSIERGESLGILIASEYPIYGRFGYGAAIESATYTVDARTARFRQSETGRIELVDRDTMRKEAPALYERLRIRRPGSIERDDRLWDRILHEEEVPGAEPPKGYCALYRSESGEIDGYLLYQAEPKWDGMGRAQGTLTVDELVSVTPAAYRRLWQFCCGVDLVTTVQAADRPVEEPLAWLLYDGRAVHQSARFDFVWVRILDVCAALSARRYLMEGRVVIEVKDELGFATGRYELEGGPDGASCARTSEPAELSLAVDTLGSLYMGGMSLRSLAEAGRIEEHHDGALGRADLMFRSAIIPWCSTWF